METVYSSGRRRPHMSLLSVPDFSFVGLHRRLCPHFRPSLVSVHASGLGAGGAIPASWSFVELRLRQHVCAALAPGATFKCFGFLPRHRQHPECSIQSAVLSFVPIMFWHPLCVLASSQALLQLEYVKLARSNK
jgi:hypothetical protein